MSDYYDPDGRAITLEQFSALLTSGTKSAEQLKTDTGRGTVSTVWLGADHSWGDGPPLIFETMAFCDGPLNNAQERYSTREQANAGHERMVERLEAERSAWSALESDERVVGCVRVVADELAAHCQAFGIDYCDLGEMFNALATAARAGRATL